MVFEYEYAVGTQPCSGCQLTVLHPDSLHPDSFHGDQVCDGGCITVVDLRRFNVDDPVALREPLSMT